jgi:hypothetical protein
MHEGGGGTPAAKILTDANGHLRNHGAPSWRSRTASWRWDRDEANPQTSVSPQIFRSNAEFDPHSNISVPLHEVGMPTATQGRSDPIEHGAPAPDRRRFEARLMRRGSCGAPPAG